MQKRHRIFIAINMPQDVKRELVSCQKKWPELPARWVSLDNLHITLVFLGYLTDEELGEVCIITKEVAQKHNSFDINLNKISYGPIGKIPPRPHTITTIDSEGKSDNVGSSFGVGARMIWVGGEKSEEMNLIKNDLENSLSENINFVSEKRFFNPHITLARLNAFEWRTINPEERPEVNENIDLNFTVESLEVMESKLKRTGPEYSVIESHNLQ